MMPLDGAILSLTERTSRGECMSPFWTLEAT